MPDSRPIRVPTVPPDPLPELEQAAPAGGMEWLAGHWHWDDLRWVWVPGRWETPPAGKRWNPPVYGSREGRFVYVAGSFGCARDAAP